jgi:uncharacterized protein
MFNIVDSFIIVLGGFAAGFVNAIAGGGTLISFPILTAVGIPVVSANITSTVSLSPGYLSATFAQLKDLKGQKKRLLYIFPFAIVGGILGGFLLLKSGDKLFRSVVPFLILAASCLLAIQVPLKKWLDNIKKKEKAIYVSFWTLIAIFFAAIYGGYFGAGLSVIVMAVLALSINENLVKLNALKQAVGFSVNISTAIFFLFSGKVVWFAVVIMAIGAILGGWVGGKVASRVNPTVLRYFIVFLGLVISVVYFVK